MTIKTQDSFAPARLTDWHNKWWHGRDSNDRWTLIWSLAKGAVMVRPAAHHQRLLTRYIASAKRDFVNDVLLEKPRALEAMELLVETDFAEAVRLRAAYGGKRDH